MYSVRYNKAHNKPITTRDIPKMNRFSVARVTELLKKIMAKAKDSV